MAIDFKKLSKVAQGKIEDSARSPEREERLQAIKDAIAKRKASQEAVNKRKSVNDSDKNKSTLKFSQFRVTDSYKALKKKIKDALEETETTDDAVSAVMDILDCPDCSPEQTIAATVEVLAEAIDVLQERLPEVTPEADPDPEANPDPETDPDPEPDPDPAE